MGSPGSTQYLGYSGNTSTSRKSRWKQTNETSTMTQPQAQEDHLEVPFVVQEKGPWPLVPRHMGESMYSGYTKNLNYVFPLEQTRVVQKKTRRPRKTK